MSELWPQQATRLWLTFWHADFGAQKENCDDHDRVSLRTEMALSDTDPTSPCRIASWWAAQEKAWTQNNLSFESSTTMHVNHAFAIGFAVFECAAFAIGFSAVSF